MRPLKVKLGWRHFFGSDPYPFTLEDVAERDNTQLQSRFVADLIPETSKLILDLGCGHGRHTEHLARSETQYVVGIDRYPPRQTTVSNKRYIAADFNNLPLADGVVDVCVCLYSSLGYNSDAGTSISEISRVSKFGAIMILDLQGRRKLVSFKRDPLRGGTGYMVSLRLGNTVHQFNLVIFQRSFELFSLRYWCPNLEQALFTLHQEGWKAIRQYGDFDGNPYSKKSTRLILVACLER